MYLILAEPANPEDPDFQKFIKENSIRQFVEGEFINDSDEFALVDYFKVIFMHEDRKVLENMLSEHFNADQEDYSYLLSEIIAIPSSWLK